MQVEKLPVKWFSANLKLAKKHPQYIWFIWLPEQLLHWISVQTWVRNSHQNIQKQQPGLHYSGFWIPIQNIQFCSRCCITPLLLANICNSWTWGVNTNSTHRRPKISIVFSKDSGNSLGKSQQQPSQTERTQLSCTMKTQLWLFAELWCCNWQRPGQVCPREFQCHAAVPVPECPTQSSRSIVMPSPSQCWTGRLKRIQNIW